MYIKQVKNFGTYLILRLFIVLSLCFLTYSMTGRIADSEAILGFINYNAYGIRTLTAQNIFAIFANLNNLYLIIITISLITSSITYFLLKKYIDNYNIYYWYILLIAPGIILYTNSPTKETLFFFPSILYIILENNSLLYWNRINFYEKLINIILKTIIFFCMYRIRGDLAITYLIITAAIFILTNFHFGNYLKKLSLSKGIFIAFILSIFIIFLWNILFPIETQKLFDYLFKSFSTYSSSSRNYINYNFLMKPLNSVTIQYLGLFPTINELISKPYSIIIVIESIIYIFLYNKIWGNLFKLVKNYNQFKTNIYFIFISITLIYFVIFGYLSCLNLGSGQRFKTNFIPLGMFFPLILEKNIRDLLTSQNIN